MEASDDSGQMLGYVLTVTDSEGYGGDIQLSMGVRMTARSTASRF